LRVAFFSDIHGNLPALEAAIDYAGKIDKYIILGDVVNYGPWSNECVSFLENLKNCIKLKGNHEHYFLNGKCESSNELANIFFDFCYQYFDLKEKIQDYRDEYLFEDFTCKHTLNKEYIFSDTNIKIEKNFIIGHSHAQYINSNNGNILVNPGSVGQNRKLINEINFMTYDTNNKTFFPHTTYYDVDELIDKMIDMKYPKVCIDYYLNKKRK